MAHPATAVTYGRSKSGKTVDLLYTVPNALWLVPAGGNLEAWSVLTGIKPEEIVVNGFDHTIGILKDIKAGKRRKPSAVVLDDLSILAERTHLILDPRGGGGFQMWGHLKRKLLTIRDLCIEMGLPWFTNAHEKPPEITDQGIPVLGGPKLPSKSMTADFPHIANLVLRVGHDGFAQPPHWPGTYICDPTDAQWVMGDRYVVVPPKSPMNLREILHRAAEVRPPAVAPAVPPRPRGLEWLDDAAEGLARGLASGQIPDTVVAVQVLTTVRKYQSKDPRHLYWAWRDGCARYELRQHGIFTHFTTPLNAQAGVRALGS